MVLETHTVSYDSSFEDEKYKVIELPAAVLAALENDEILCIKGRKNDEAILTTKDASFVLRKAETSNVSLILTSTPNKPNFNGNLDLKVASSFTSHLEMVPHRPRFSRLHEVLTANYYCGKFGEEESNNGLSLDFLQGEIQCDETALQRQLEKVGALRLNDRYYLLHPKTELDACEQFLAYVAAESAPSNTKIPVRTTCVELGTDLGYTPAVFRHACRLLGSLVLEDGEEYCLLDEEKVARFRARQLLSTGLRWEISRFMDSWGQICADFTPKLEWIHDFILQYVSGDEEYVRLFQECDLADDLKERLRQLFEAKQEWESSRILLFLQMYVPIGQSDNEFLRRNCRVYARGGVQYVVARK
eukprot:GCRY01004882.1.p1 GENE.GCRY01004882.1~~GCRY01004882.1.p1  ORF type:complete len:360 (+),score=89.22 GCRY01004882.1:130-1209(+)